MMFHKHFLLGWLVAFSGCTFGDLGGYAIGECNPLVKSLAEDECNQFNDADSCQIFQCDPGERRCILSARDEDRDGDPQKRCGGQDCDDGDGDVSSLGHEVCDGKDNDCDGLIDEGVLEADAPVPILPTGALPAFPDVSVGGPSAAELMGTYVAKRGVGTCIQAVSLGMTPGALLPECSFLTDGPTLVPRQPSALPLVQGGGGVVFLRTDGCAKGALSYRYTGQGSSGVIDRPCDGPGAANPAWLPTEDGASALVTWYSVPLSKRDDPLEQCAEPAVGGSQYAPLEAAWLDKPASGSPALSDPFELGPNSASLGPASLVRLGAKAFLVASPLEDDVGLWRLSQGEPLAPSTRIPGLNGARAVALGAHPDKTTPTTVHVAVAAEIGCGPQAVRVVLGTLDTVSGEIQLGKAVEVLEAGQGIATRPGVAWVDPRGEWLVSWITAGPARLRAQRLTLEGQPIDEPLTLAWDVISARLGEDGGVGAFDVKTSTFEKVAAACHP